MTWRTWLLCGVLALLAGTLIRDARVLGIPALRMFGFWCLVAIGLIMARGVAREQAADGWRRLRAALEELGPGFHAVDVGPGLLAVVAPAALLVLVADEMPQYGRGPLARRRQRRAEERARRAAARAAAVVKGMRGEAGEVPVLPVLVLLRRRAGGAGPGAVPGPEGRVVAVNPEGVGELARRFTRPALLDEGERQALAGALAVGLHGAAAVS